MLLAGVISPSGNPLEEVSYKKQRGTTYQVYKLSTVLQYLILSQLMLLYIILKCVASVMNHCLLTSSWQIKNKSPRKLDEFFILVLKELPDKSKSETVSTK